jgi:hypothetical protein
MSTLPPDPSIDEQLIDLKGRTLCAKVGSDFALKLCRLYVRNWESGHDSWSSSA